MFKQKLKALKFIFLAMVLSFLANSFCLIYSNKIPTIPIILIFLSINLLAGIFTPKTSKFRMRCCSHGANLLFLFEISTLVSIVFHIILAFYLLPQNWVLFLWSALFCFTLQFLTFWNGIICVYLTSVQLGIKHRVIGAVCGMIPVVNLICLNIILKTVFKEIAFETEKEKINNGRKEQQICKTKYPILLVHGVFFRDSNFFNYWGRIPKELELNGATIFYGNHSSASSVCDSAAELTERIKEIAKTTGCEKVNVIAHSKGGLDCRYAISNLSAAPYVASLTTINTPHRGCVFADYLLNHASQNLKNNVAKYYNSALKKFGDKKPDFISAVSNLTASFCEDFDQKTPIPQGIFCQSVGSKLKKATSGKFPLNLSYLFVKHFDGANDGLVGEDSFRWGEQYTFAETKGTEGISHGDMIDLNRRNFEGFDVREFYVKLVNDLKRRGL